MRPSKKQPDGSDDLFRARLDQFIMKEHELVRLAESTRPAVVIKRRVRRGEVETYVRRVPPSMRFVAIKTVDRQAALMLHRTWDLLSRQRTMLVNALRAHMAEFGVVAASGPEQPSDPHQGDPGSQG